MEGRLVDHSDQSTSDRNSTCLHTTTGEAHPLLFTFNVDRERILPCLKNNSERLVDRSETRLNCYVSANECLS